MWNPFDRHRKREMDAAEREVAEKKFNKRRLTNLLGYICSQSDSRNHDNNAIIFTFIKILTDKIVPDNAGTLITADKELPSSTETGNLFVQPDHRVSWKYDIERVIYGAFYEDPINVSVDIDLAKDPVITFPWNQQRLMYCAEKIGGADNPWQEKSNNHFARLLLPMGVTHIYNGLHSTFTGMIKREGMLSFYDGSNHSVHDISRLYPLLQFDGTDYLIAGSDVIAGKARSFEFGCIFEIGRMLHEKGVCFKSLLR